MNFQQIMDHAEQFPLDVYFDFAPQAEAVQPQITSDIAEDRLNQTHSFTVNLSAIVTIYFSYHLFRICFFCIFSIAVKKGHLSGE